MHRLRSASIALVWAVTLLLLVQPAPAAGWSIQGVDAVWVWPLDPTPTVVRGFLPPAYQWGAGHRGADLAGSALEPVLAMRDGVVTVAAPLAGRGVVVVDHGRLRSTYEPVTASVHVGQRVSAGQVIGLLQSTHSHCAPEVCLHVGLKRADTYLDPLSVLGPRDVRLKPQSSTRSPVGGASAGPAPAATPEHRDRAASAQQARSAASAPQPRSRPGHQLRLGIAVGVVAIGVSAMGWRRRWLEWL